LYFTTKTAGFNFRVVVIFHKLKQNRKWWQWSCLYNICSWITY